MAVAFDGAPALPSVLVRFFGDPWAREVLSGLGARLTQLDALAEDMREYAETARGHGITHASVGICRGAARSS